jgi:hypothetical protein
LRFGYCRFLSAAYPEQQLLNRLIVRPRRRYKVLSFATVLLFIALAPVEARAADGIGTTVVIPVKPQAWQTRRAEFAKEVRGAQVGETAARLALDAALTDFEKHPMSRTPMEVMDIIGVAYAPKDPIDKVVQTTVTYAALGWYDALRFGSESGQAEIVNNEGFFRRAFVLSGNETMQRIIAYLRADHARAARIIEQGLKIAELHRDDILYDRRWPTAYGLERMICAQGGACTPIPEMPRERWDKAWDDVKQRVMAYYGPK